MYKTMSLQKGFNLIVPFMERKVALDIISQHLPPSKKWSSVLIPGSFPFNLSSVSMGPPAHYK